MSEPWTLAQLDQFDAASRDLQGLIASKLAASDEATRLLGELDALHWWEIRRRRELYEAYVSSERHFGLKPLPKSHFRRFF